MSLYIWTGRETVGVGIEVTELTVEALAELPLAIAPQGTVCAEGTITFEDYAEGDGEPFKREWAASTNYLKDGPGNWKVWQKETSGLLVYHKGQTTGLFRIDNDVSVDTITSQWIQRFIAMRLCDCVVRSNPLIPTIVVEKKPV